MESELEVSVEAQPDRFQCAGDQIAVIDTEFPINYNLWNPRRN
jgi:hypothetical protein